jgi:hypothetical protein
MSTVDVVLLVFRPAEERNPCSRPRSITMTWNSTGRGRCRTPEAAMASRRRWNDGRDGLRRGIHRTPHPWSADLAPLCLPFTIQRGQVRAYRQPGTVRSSAGCGRLHVGDDAQNPDDLRAAARPAGAAGGRSESATCLDRRWEPGDLGSSGAERGGLARESAAVTPRVFWLTNGSAARPAHPVRLWLKRGLRCLKLHCPPRLKMPPMARR